MTERSATSEEKKNGFDLADYLIGSELEAQRNNEIADKYNAQIDRIKGDPEMLATFEDMLDERVAVMAAEGVTNPEEEAKNPENIRLIVDYLLSE